MDGACHVGKVVVMCWRMESVRMWRTWSLRAERVVRLVEAGRVARVVDWGGRCIVRV